MKALSLPLFKKRGTLSAAKIALFGTCGNTAGIRSVEKTKVLFFFVQPLLSYGLQIMSRFSLFLLSYN
jgi:hypothetical protein